jgi:general secretion pathway protein A
MYADFYKLSGKPFQLSPSPRFFFGSRGHRKAMDYLTYGLHQGEGFIVITGDIGTGKTTLLGYLLGQLDQSKYLAAKLVTTQVEADDTLRMVASAFGVETQGADKATLLRRFESFLRDNQRRGRRALMLMDECQNLPVRSLEELRMLSNFQFSDIPPIQFFLLGQPQFQSILASDDLVQLRQRVIASYHLGPLTADETQAYIEHRLHLVNWQSDPIITGDAYSQIHQFSAGVARQINVLCDRLLLHGMLEELHQIDAGVVESVANDMSAEFGSVTPKSATSATPRPRQKPLAPPIDQEDNRLLERRVGAVEQLVLRHDKILRQILHLIMKYLSHGSNDSDDEDAK